MTRYSRSSIRWPGPAYFKKCTNTSIAGDVLAFHFQQLLTPGITRIHLDNVVSCKFSHKMGCRRFSHSRWPWKDHTTIKPHTIFTWLRKFRLPIFGPDAQRSRSSTNIQECRRTLKKTNSPILEPALQPFNLGFVATQFGQRLRSILHGP